MSTYFGLMLTASLTGVGADPETDRVVGAMKEHFARIHSVRVKATVRPVESGGLLAEDPARSPLTYSKRTDFLSSEYEVWLSPPKYRQFWADNGRPSPRVYYDGKTFTHMDLRTGSGFTSKDGSQVRPMRINATHAIGFCFLDTLHTSLAELVDGCGSLKVSRAGVEEGREIWLVEIKSLPAAVQPRDWPAEAHKSALVRIWLNIEPEVVIRRWAVFHPTPKLSDEVQQFMKSRNIRVQTLPIFQLDGHVVREGFVNCDFKPTRDELRGRNIPMPRRVFTGNFFGVGSCEVTIQEIALNPKESPDTFRPTANAGFKMTERGERGSRPQVSGDEVGTAIRVKEISRQARDMLSSGESLRAEDSKSQGWPIPALGAALAIASAAIGFVIWKWRSVR